MKTPSKRRREKRGLRSPLRIAFGVGLLVSASLIGLVALPTQRTVTSVPRSKPSPSILDQTTAGTFYKPPR
jgi:hypothetical protein